MKKLILILALVFALTLCFVACEDLGDNSDDGQSQNVLLNGAPYTEEPTTEEPTTEENTTCVNIVDEYDAELNSVFTEILERIIDKENIHFSVNDQHLHYELRNMGAYKGITWVNPYFSIRIFYDKDLVQNTEWYKRVENKDRKNLSNSFCYTFSEGFENSSSLMGSSLFDGMIVSYASNEGILTDLNYVLEMSDLEYISEISIVYQYSLPKDYFM